MVRAIMTPLCLSKNEIEMRSSNYSNMSVIIFCYCICRHGHVSQLQAVPGPLHVDVGRIVGERRRCQCECGKYLYDGIHERWSVLIDMVAKQVCLMVSFDRCAPASSLPPT